MILRYRDLDVLAASSLAVSLIIPLRSGQVSVVICPVDDALVSTLSCLNTTEVRRRTVHAAMFFALSSHLPVSRRTSGTEICLRYPLFSTRRYHQLWLEQFVWSLTSDGLWRFCYSTGPDFAATSASRTGAVASVCSRAVAVGRRVCPSAHHDLYGCCSKLLRWGVAKVEPEMDRCHCQQPIPLNALQFALHSQSYHLTVSIAVTMFDVQTRKVPWTS